MAAELGAGLRIFRDVSRRQPCRDTPASFASIWGWGCACLLLFSFPPFYLFIYLFLQGCYFLSWVEGDETGQGCGSFPFLFSLSVCLFPFSLPPLLPPVLESEFAANSVPVSGEQVSN